MARYDKTIKNSNSFLTNTPHKIRKQARTGACFLYAAKGLGPAGGEIPVFLDFYSDSCKINQYAKLHKNGEDEQYPDCTAREREARGLKGLFGIAQGEGRIGVQNGMRAAY